MNYDVLPADLTIDKTIKALKNNGFEVSYFKNEGTAKNKIREILPDGVSVMNMTSVTLTTLGIDKEIQESGKYKSVRNVLMNQEISAGEKRAIGAAPDWAIGSVHAVTENGEVMIASNTGSQLPAYAYGAGKVIWVVGAQKIVKYMETGYKRIYEYCLPKESERASIAYGVPGSAVNKILIVNKEVQAGRIFVILINKVLGF